MAAKPAHALLFYTEFSVPVKRQHSGSKYADDEQELALLEYLAKALPSTCHLTGVRAYGVVGESQSIRVATWTFKSIMKALSLKSVYVE